MKQLYFDSFISTVFSLIKISYFIMSQKSRFWSWIDQKVKIDLKDNRSIIGVLIGFDKHLNFVVSDAEELRVF